MSEIIYIGQDDREITLFESQYALPEGMCYNSYVIKDEKTAVVDTSDPRTMEGWKADLQKALGGAKPDYLIVQHLEPDHASGIGEFMDLYPEAKIVCTASAAKMLPLFFPGRDFKANTQTVKEGDTLSLGEHSLTFIMAPMVHWPEVMVCYEQKSKSLFSADAFGKFGVRDAEPDDWACEARRYYFNICGKYGAQVQALLGKVAKLDVTRVLPLHGPELEGEKLANALRLYGIWSTYGVESEGVFIAHASIHGCTAEAAEKLAEIIRAKGVKVSVADLCRDDQAEAIEDAFKYGKLVLAASTYDSGLFPIMYDFIHHLQIKGWQKREVALIENGSWAPQAAKFMTQMLGEMKDITIKGAPVTLRGKMKAEDIPSLEALAEAIVK